MGRFDWQTEEDGTVAPTVVPVPRRRYAGWIAALTVIGMVGLAITAYWQLGRQAELRANAVAEDVLAAFGVWRQAAIGQDVDLLDTLLLGGEPEWTATQRRLIESGLAFKRESLGLILDQDSFGSPSAQPVIDLAGNWRTAELSFPLVYRPVSEVSDAAGIELEQTLFLAREGSRWLLQRPGDEFWGEWRLAAGDLVTVTYRSRDEAWVDRLLVDLDEGVKEICSGAEVCPRDASVAVRLEDDPQVLFKLIDRHTPSFAGRTYILPSPTLVGRPLDDAGYDALYKAYSKPILETFAAMLATPIQLPDQIVTMLCFSRNGNLPRLYSYDPVKDVWNEQLDERSFRFLAADESDSSLILREVFRGQPHRLRMVQWSGGLAITRHDATYGPLTDHQFGFSGSDEQTKLLLSSFEGTMRTPSHRVVGTQGVDLTACPQSGCVLYPLDGFPVWSPDGGHSLVVNGSHVFLADHEGQSIMQLAEGHSPFWLDEQRYGFVTEAEENSRQISVLVTGLVGSDQLSELWRAHTMGEAGLESALAVDSPVFIQHVVAARGESKSLIMYGRQYAGADSHYIFVSLPTSLSATSTDEPPHAGAAFIELSLDGPPASIPSTGDPNGHRPFLMSANGRWLAVGQLIDKGTDLWAIYVTEIGRDNVISYSTHYPGFSFDQPFFDWSSDGRWLLIVDENFLRLAAPALGYQRIIAHDHRSCSYPAWLNRSGLE